MNLYAFNAPRGPRFHRLLCVLACFSLGANEPAPTGPALARRVAKLASGDFRVHPDPALSKLAEGHAHEILDQFGSAQRSRVKRALRREGLADAQVLPFAATGSDPEALAAKVARFARIEARPRGPTHVGVGLVARGDRWAVVAVFSRRTVALAPLPPRLPASGLRVRGRARPSRRLEGYLLGPVQGAKVGPVRRLEVDARGEAVAVDVPPPDGPGRYVFQIVDVTARGPELAAQWTFEVPPTRGPWPPPAPTAQAEDAAGALALLATARAEAERAPLTPHPALARAAERHAEAMCRTKVTAHRVPGGRAPEARARAAGYVGRISENVARAATVGAAHRNLALSPSHRVNLLDPTAAHVGVGVAVAPAAEGLAASRCLVQLFGHPARADDQR